MTTVSCFPGTKSPIDSTIYLFPMHVTMLLIVQYTLVCVGLVGQTWTVLSMAATGHFGEI